MIRENPGRLARMAPLAESKWLTSQGKSRKEFFFAILPVFTGIWLYLAIFGGIFSGKTGGYGGSIQVHLVHFLHGTWNRNDGSTPLSLFLPLSDFQRTKRRSAQ
jgi:hypothetical protein